MLIGRYYDPKQPRGSRWSKGGVTSIPRMYHSSATLLPDGTVFVSGSNPNADCERNYSTNVDLADGRCRPKQCPRHEICHAVSS